MEISSAVEESVEQISMANQSFKKYEENNNRLIGVIQNLSAIAEETPLQPKKPVQGVHAQTQSINNISDASSNLAYIAQDLQQEISVFQI